MKIDNNITAEYFYVTNL